MFLVFLNKINTYIQGGREIMKRQIANFSKRIKACFLFPLALILLVVMAVSGYYDKDDYDWGEYDDYVGKMH